MRHWSVRMSLLSQIFKLLVEQQESPSNNKGQCHWCDSTELFPGTLLDKPASVRSGFAVLQLIVYDGVWVSLVLWPVVDDNNDNHLLRALFVPTTMLSSSQGLSD